MKNVYLDVNGDIIDAIFALPNEHRIDQILQDIVKIRKDAADVEEYDGFEALKNKSKKSKVIDLKEEKEKKKKKSSSKKKKEEKMHVVRLIKRK